MEPCLEFPEDSDVRKEAPHWNGRQLLLQLTGAYVHMHGCVCAPEVWPGLLSLVIPSHRPDFVSADVTVQSWGWPAAGGRTSRVTGKERHSSIRDLGVMTLNSEPSGGL